MSSSWLVTAIVAVLLFAQNRCVLCWKHRRRLVAKRPKRLLNVYMYNLQKRWKVDTILHGLERCSGATKSFWCQSNCDWNKHVCREKEWQGGYSTMRQYGADVTIIEKFKHYDNLVTDPNDADIFLVPYPHASHCRSPDENAGWRHCEGIDWRSSWDLVKSLPYFNEKTKNRHLFLLTQDLGNNHKLLEDMPLYVTLGGSKNPHHDHEPPPNVTNIVIPPPITEPEYQPSTLAKRNWTEQRNYSLYMNAGLISPDRKVFADILNHVKSIGGLPTLNSDIYSRVSSPTTFLFINHQYALSSGSC